ncbi:MAG: class II glutamine amidotransferase [Planctomycetes bacterium]|nr:class II glutamine amidotransferase [Planctomycetota bacterium]
MCRFLAYKGREMFMSDLISKSAQSLIRQSYQAKHRKEPLNGDGFGVGWYVPEIDPTPCVFTSITPAWSNANLRRLAEKIRSACIFAHVRAATPGLLVSEVNCHPFQYDRFLWMHNGDIGQFDRIKRRLRQSLSDELYNFIQGTTDSEHAFAVFLNELTDHMEDQSIDCLEKAVRATINQLNAWGEEVGASVPSHLNFAITDGQSVIATRYVNDPAREPPSLYISRGERFECLDGRCRMVSAGRDVRAAIIASEPLTEAASDWEQIPRNHMVTITPDMHVRISPIE